MRGFAGGSCQIVDAGAARLARRMTRQSVAPARMRARRKSHLSRPSSASRARKLFQKMRFTPRNAQPGSRCSSLVGVRIANTNLSFAKIFDKLKATIDDGSNRYQLTVSSRVLKEAWRVGGLAAVNNAVPARREFHVRVGLARPYGDPPKCYAMLNGVL